MKRRGEDGLQPIASILGQADITSPSAHKAKGGLKKAGEEGLQPIGAIMRHAGIAPPSAHKLRLIDAAVAIAAGEDDREIAYHHTVFCQAFLGAPRFTQQSIARISPQLDGAQLRVPCGA